MPLVRRKQPSTLTQSPALHLGDCLDVLPTLAAESIDAVVTDPPYGLKFMGKRWDHGIPGVHFWRAIADTMKPGAHLLAFGGTRTHHRLMCAIEDAGFELRDVIMWVYGSGFPKSLNVSKAIDKAAGVRQDIVQAKSRSATRPHVPNQSKGKSDASITAPATVDAQRWDGWGTALKPAWEPIIVARKLLPGTVAANVLEHSTGGLNIDSCRVNPGQKVSGGGNGKAHNGGRFGARETAGTRSIVQPHNAGRFPANLIHDGSDEVVELFPQTKSGSIALHHRRTTTKTKNSFSERVAPPEQTIGDSGSAARFFYCAKASRAERNGNLPDGVINSHPTVKPLALMRYLCRLVTPPDGVILDPFMGSGSTGVAARKESFRFIGIEEDVQSFDTAAMRVNGKLKRRRKRL